MNIETLKHANDLLAEKSRIKSSIDSVHNFFESVAPEDIVVVDRKRMDNFRTLIFLNLPFPKILSGLADQIIAEGQARIEAIDIEIAAL